MMVVIAGNDQHLVCLSQRLADRAQHPECRPERVAPRTLSELDHVTQQHEPVGASSAGDEAVAGLGLV